MGGQAVFKQHGGIRRVCADVSVIACRIELRHWPYQLLHRDVTEGAAEAERFVQGQRGLLGGKVKGANGLVTVLAGVLDFVISIGLVTGLIALIYRYMPARRMQWRPILWGALVTALLFHLGRWGIAWYLGRSSQPSAFGAAASFAAMLLWLYYSAQIFLLGAEFTWVYAHAHGSRVGENRGARVEEMVEQKAETPVAPLPAAAPTIAAAVRLAPRPLPPMPQPEELPIHQRKPLVTFGVAAALGALAGFVFRTRPEFVYHRPRRGLLSRLR